MVHDVVIVGGGLTGLAAAYELEQLQIPYTLIEVKKRLGGSIVTEQRAGFVVDGWNMAVSLEDDWSFLPELGLADALIPLEAGQAVFQAGVESLVQALARPLKGPIIKRMAVSSLGQWEERFGVCLENGLVREARALIITAPARYAAHMLGSLEAQVGARLAGYHYDSLVRLSLGFRRDAFPTTLELPPDMAYVYAHQTDHLQRCPPEHVLVQLGLRFKPEHITAPDWIGTLLRELNWPLDPSLAAAYIWPEADPLTCYDPGYAAVLAEIAALLPERVALVGSDYGASSLAARVHQGRAAARKIAATLA